MVYAGAPERPWKRCFSQMRAGNFNGSIPSMHIREQIKKDYTINRSCEKIDYKDVNI